MYPQKSDQNNEGVETKSYEEWLQELFSLEKMIKEKRIHNISDRYSKMEQNTRTKR